MQPSITPRTRDSEAVATETPSPIFSERAASIIRIFNGGFSMRRQPRVAILFLGVALAVIGCGGSDGAVKLVKAGGVVTFQGKPLGGATVTFIPANGPIAMGTSDKDGKFALFTGTSSGVVVGKCAVSVAMYATSDDETDDLKGLSESERDEKLTQMMGKNVGKFGADKKASILPAKFADSKTSGLEFTVADSPDKNDFDLKL
jgi:hypothetical protein